MITVDAIQSDLRDLIAAHATFSGLDANTVLAWDNTQFETQQQTLQAQGITVEVCRVDSERVIDQRTGLVLVEATIPVILHVNPERNDPANNSSAADVDFKDAVSAIISAALDYRPTHGETRYRLTESGNAVELLADLEGELAALIVFTRQAIRYQATS